MSEVINDLNLHGCDKISDHSVLVYEIALCNNVEEGISEQSSTSSFKRYRLNEIPGSFFNCEESFSRVMHSINRIEKSPAEDADGNVAYHEFISLIKSEMAEKLKVKKPYCVKPHKSRNKPYWNDDLQVLWNEVCLLEKAWLK